MGSKVEKIEVALAQNIPFEDEVVETRAEVHLGRGS